MQIMKTVLDGVVILEPRVFEDDRGFFLESWNARVFEELTGVEATFVQDNHSRSSAGVLRGLHYQLPSPQGKLVRCTAGAVFDVAVDIRRSSPTFADWVGVELSEANRMQLWIPEGFAHGFVALSDTADLQYKATDYYDASADRSIRWSDPEIGITWPIKGEPELSEKDRTAPALAEAIVFD